MGLGIFFGLGWSAAFIVGACLGDLGPVDYRQIWIVALATPIAAVLLSYAGRVSVFFPRMVMGCCVLLAPGMLAAAIISLVMEQARFALPLGIWCVTSAVSVWICSRIHGSYVQMLIAAEEGLLSMTCPHCGGHLELVDFRNRVCPHCAYELPSKPRRCR